MTPELAQGLSPSLSRPREGIIEGHRVPGVLHPRRPETSKPRALRLHVISFEQAAAGEAAEHAAADLRANAGNSRCGGGRQVAVPSAVAVGGWESRLEMAEEPGVAPLPDGGLQTLAQAFIGAAGGQLVDDPLSAAGGRTPAHLRTVVGVVTHLQCRTALVDLRQA